MALCVKQWIIFDSIFWYIWSAHHMVLQILFSRILMFFQQICCLFWSPQNEFLFENQNVQKNAKIIIYFYEKSQTNYEKAVTNRHFRIREKKIREKISCANNSEKKVHDYQSINLVLIWKPLDILNERTINRMIDSAIYSWWSGQIGRAKDCGPSLNTQSCIKDQ